MTHGNASTTLPSRNNWKSIWMRGDAIGGANFYRGQSRMATTRSLKFQATLVVSN